MGSSTPTSPYFSWSTSPTTFPHILHMENFTMPMPIQLDPPTRKPNTLLHQISLAVRVVLFVICLVENSISIFILYKNIRKGRKTFARYTLISVACTDILNALLYYPAEFVRFKHGELVWLAQGQAGDFLCKIYVFLVQIPGNVLVLCLVALACDVARNLSSKGRREHTRKFSVILMFSFWIIAAGLSAMYPVISKVELRTCGIDPAKQTTAVTMSLIHSFALVLPADLILTIVNLVIFCRVRRRKKELTRRKREARRAGRMKGRRQRKRKEDVKNAEVQQLTEEAQEMRSSIICEPGGDATNQQQGTSSNPETLIEMSTETNEGSGGSDVDVMRKINLH